MRTSPLFVLAALSCAATSLWACSDNARVEDPTEADELGGADEKDIFAKPDAFAVKISAPFSTLFARYKARQADPPPPPNPEAGAPRWQEPEFSEPAKLVFTDNGATKTLDLRVYVRGESSKFDCPFTKLKLDFSDKEQLKKTPFKGHGKMRLNTHCGPGDASARSGMGRVFNGVGPVREELGYRLVRAAGIPTYLTRVIAVHYDDTANQAQLDSFGLLVESGDDAAQRFAAMTPPLIPTGAQYLSPNEAQAMQITPDNTAQIAIAEAFVGNRDWFGTHNIDSFGVLPAATGFQIAQDFDLSAITLGDIARYPIAELALAKPSLASAATVKATIRAQKSAMEAAYLEAEKAMLAAKAIAPAADGVTTTDPGFLEAKKRMKQLFEFPEMQGQ